MRSAHLLSAAGVAAALALTPTVASAERMVGVDTANRLVSFQSKKPGTVKRRTLTGLASGETLVGLDRRPANGQLIGLGSTSLVYLVNRTTGAATPIGVGPFEPALNGTSFGFDFNPMVDLIRLTSNFTQNLRLQPDTGTVAATDGALSYPAGDPNAGKVAAIAGSAYTNSVAMAMSTQLFDIDVTNDVLALQEPPNAGGLKTVGPLGQGDLASPVGFDIAGKTGIAFASLRQKGRKGTALYTINLATGRAVARGRIGSKRTPVTLRALTVAE